MGTEVLRPQDCLIHQRIRVAPVVFPRRKSNYGNGNGQIRANVGNNGNRKVQIRPEQRRRSPEPAGPKRSASVGDFKTRSNQVGMGQVTILRRGESIDWKEKVDLAPSMRGNGDDAVLLSGTERLGPCPEMVPKQIRMSRPSSGAGDVYAGSAFSLSPSPRAVPLPSFFNRKSSPNTVDDSATKDLRRLLRLEWKNKTYPDSGPDLTIESSVSLQLNFQKIANFPWYFFNMESNCILKLRPKESGPETAIFFFFF